MISTTGSRHGRQDAFSMALAAFNNPVLKLLADAIGRKDPYTLNHGMRVALYSARLAGRLGLDAEETFWIAVGGFLHDIGKLGFSDRIFSSIDLRLSPRMRAEVKCHPVTGALLLKPFPMLRPVIPMILYHHERSDGRGYPFGISESRIPLGARIVSVADCFDAMTTDRPYQRRKAVHQALAMLGEMGGDCLSADLVRTFVDDIGSGGIVTMAEC